MNLYLRVSEDTDLSAVFWVGPSTTLAAFSLAYSTELSDRVDALDTWLARFGSLYNRI